MSSSSFTISSQSRPSNYNLQIPGPISIVHNWWLTPHLPLLVLSISRPSYQVVLSRIASPVALERPLQSHCLIAPLGAQIHRPIPAIRLHAHALAEPKGQPALPILVGCDG